MSLLAPTCMGGRLRGLRMGLRVWGRLSKELVRGCIRGGSLSVVGPARHRRISGPADIQPCVHAVASFYSIFGGPTRRTEHRY